MLNKSKFRVDNNNNNNDDNISHSSKKGGYHSKSASAVLSMPSLFRATSLSYKSPISKFSTYRVEEKDSLTGEEYLMKSIKNNKCLAVQLKYILDKLRTLEHYNLPRISYVTYSNNYSYIVFEKASSFLNKLLPISSYFNKISNNESICRQIIYELCRTIQFTHAFGFIHRDLRPSNVFIDISATANDFKLNKLLLLDFGCTQALKADQQLAILESGSGYLSSYVLQEHNQYPSPEILMDLNYNSSVDSWFIGILIYMILYGGNIPFIGDNNDDIFDNILHSTNSNSSFIHPDNRNIYFNISSELDDIISGLLIKDNKKRYSVDYILFNEWIPKINLINISKKIINYWMRKYHIARQKQTETIFKLINNYISISNNIIQSNYKNSSASNSDLCVFINKSRTIIHQFKLIDYINSNIKSDCYITISSNIWIKYGINPIQIEYNIDYVKYDIYFGIISLNEFIPNNNYYYYIGSDQNSISLSIRYGRAYFNQNDVGNIKKNEYLKSKKQNNNNNNNKFGGPTPLRNVRVLMRIDSTSRTLSFKINDVILNPLFYEFPGYVVPSFTLCSCMDQVTIKNVTYDDMPNLGYQ